MGEINGTIGHMESEHATDKLGGAYPRCKIDGYNTDIRESSRCQLDPHRWSEIVKFGMTTRFSVN